MIEDEEEICNANKNDIFLYDLQVGEKLFILY